MPENNSKKTKKISVWKKLLITKDVKERLQSFLKNDKVAEDFINLCRKVSRYRDIWVAIVDGHTLQVCHLLNANKQVFVKFVDWKRVEKRIKTENKKRLIENRKGGLVVNPKGAKIVVDDK